MKFNIHWPWTPDNQHSKIPLYLIILKLPFWMITELFVIGATATYKIWGFIEKPFIRYLNNKSKKYWKKVYEERNKLDAKDPKA